MIFKKEPDMREALKLLSEIKEEVSELDKVLKAIAEQIALYDKTCLGDVEPVTTVTTSQPIEDINKYYEGQKVNFNGQDCVLKDVSSGRPGEDIPTQQEIAEEVEKSLSSRQPFTLHKFKLSPKEELAILAAKSWPIEISSDRMDLIELAKKQDMAFVVVVDPRQQAAGK